MSTAFLLVRGRVRRPLALAAALAAVLAAGCNIDEVLRAPDPDIVSAGDLENSAAAALTLKGGVILRLAQATSGGESTFLFGGLLADEFRSSDTFEQRNTTDQRVLVPENSFLAGQLRALMRVRNEGDAAIAAMRAAPTPVPPVHVADVFGYKALAANLLAEHFCNGVPLSRLDGSREVFGEPVSNDSLYRLAAAEADSAAAAVSGGSGAAVTAALNMAAVQKGRALLNRGDFAGAAAAVSAVPTSFRFWVRHSLLTTSNQLWALNVNVRRYTVGEREGGNGLPFRSANDPRLPTTAPANRLGFDSFTPWIGQARYGRTDSVAVASGVEARLIEAEAQLRDGNAAWLTTLNGPRVVTVGGVAGLTPLADPGTPDARLDLIMRERAFWMFGTGHRLGDLRRLVRVYQRPAETVFPTGAYPKGGSYGPAVNLPVSVAELNNPKFTQCTDRDA